MQRLVILLFEPHLYGFDIFTFKDVRINCLKYTSIVQLFFSYRIGFRGSLISSKKIILLQGGKEICTLKYK